MKSYVVYNAFSSSDVLKKKTERKYTTSFSLIMNYWCISFKVTPFKSYDKERRKHFCEIKQLSTMYVIFNEVINFKVSNEKNLLINNYSKHLNYL